MKTLILSLLISLGSFNLAMATELTQENKKAVCNAIFDYYGDSSSKELLERCLVGKFSILPNGDASRTVITYSDGYLPEGARCTVAMKLKSSKVLEDGVSCGE